MCIVRVISLCVKLIRTLAYSQEKYEVYINARNSRVLYSDFLSLFTLIPITTQPSGSFLIATKPSGSFLLATKPSGTFVVLFIIRLQAHLYYLQVQLIRYLSSLQAPLLQRNKGFLFVF